MTRCKIPGPQEFLGSGEAIEFCGFGWPGGGAGLSDALSIPDWVRTLERRRRSTGSRAPSGMQALRVVFLALSPPEACLAFS